ncbi:hypothetical protein D3C71_1027020 [compost metagenome]
MLVACGKIRRVLRSEFDVVAGQAFIGADEQLAVLGVHVARVGGQRQARQDLQRAFQLDTARADRGIRADIVRGDRPAVGIGRQLDFLPVVRGDVEHRATDMPAPVEHVHLETELVAPHHFRFVAQHFVVDHVALRGCQIEAAGDIALGRCGVERECVAGVVAQ